MNGTIRCAILVVVAVVFLAPTAGAQTVDRMVIQYNHPLKDDRQSGTFLCEEPIHYTTEDMRVDVWCDSDFFDCSQNLWYFLVSGDNEYSGHNTSGGYEFGIVQVNPNIEVLKARICTQSDCGGGAGPWCELDSNIWRMPDELCDYLLQWVYVECFLYVYDEEESPINFAQAQDSCDGFDERWDCLERCVSSIDQTCLNYEICIDACFTNLGDDDDDASDDDSSDDDSGDDDASDDDSGDDDSGDDDSGDDDDDSTTGRQDTGAGDSSGMCG